MLYLILCRELAKEKSQEHGNPVIQNKIGAKINKICPTEEAAIACQKQRYSK